MPRRNKEEADLAKADRDIAAGEKRLAEQIALIRELTQHGHDTVEAEKVRRNYEQLLETFRAHRELIVAALKEARGIGQ